MSNADDEHDRRIAVIHEAVRVIREGTEEINDVFSIARGPLPKKAMRGLHTRLKDLRHAAETAEDAFRDWTVELTGRPDGVEQREHDELRTTFEVEVAAVQRCVARVAEELRRSKSTPKAGSCELEEPCKPSADIESAEPALDDSTAAQTAKKVTVSNRDKPAGSWASLLPSNNVERSSSVASSRATLPPSRTGVAPPFRSAEDRASSHTRMANTLRAIASQEEEMHAPRAEEVYHITDGCRDSYHTPGIKPKVNPGHLPVWAKSIIAIALTSLGYTIWSHARLLIHDAAREEVRWAIASGGVNVTM